MPRKKAENLDSQLDEALGGILAQGWEESPAESTDDWTVMRPAAVASEPEFPPLPTREEPVPVPSPLARAKATPTETHLEPQAHGGALKRTADVPAEGHGDMGLLDIGLLTDLAAGRKTAAEAAESAGVTEAELQGALAVALRDVPPEEIAKAMGVQAAEQQLKSGALYGAVLADLMGDMASGRLKAAEKIEIAKLLARVGRVEPKDDKNVGAGGGFQLNIVVGGNAAPVTIEAD